MSQSTDPADKTDQKNDEDEEFLELFGTFSQRLETRADSAAEARAIQKSCPDDPNLAAVRSCIADRKAGRVNPKNSPYWGQLN